MGKESMQNRKPMILVLAGPNGEPDKATKAFLDYIMGEKFGKKMESLGYGVSSKMEKTDH